MEEKELEPGYSALVIPVSYSCGLCEEKKHMLCNCYIEDEWYTKCEKCSSKPHPVLMIKTFPLIEQPFIFPIQCEKCDDVIVEVTLNLDDMDEFLSLRRTTVCEKTTFLFWNSKVCQIFE